MQEWCKHSGTLQKATKVVRPCEENESVSVRRMLDVDIAEERGRGRGGGQIYGGKVRAREI